MQLDYRCKPILSATKLRLGYRPGLPYSNNRTVTDKGGEKGWLAQAPGGFYCISLLEEGRGVPASTSLVSSVFRFHGSYGRGAASACSICRPAAAWPRPRRY